jgi:hypothetical protein
MRTVHASESASVDAFVGARMLQTRSSLDWEFEPGFGPFTGPARQGAASSSFTNWDAVAGIKGRYSFGSNGRWFVPWYGDIGTGDSDRTWQAIAGVGYAFDWGEVSVRWRHLDYRFKSGEALQDLRFDGPLAGVAFHW